MKYLSIVLLAGLSFVIYSCGSGSGSMNGHNITLDAAGHNGLISVGQYHGSDTLILDTLSAASDVFSYSGDNLLEPGVYTFNAIPNGGVLEFIVEEGVSQHFGFKTNGSSLSNPVVTGSKENAGYFDFKKNPNSKSQFLSSLKNPNGVAAFLTNASSLAPKQFFEQTDFSKAWTLNSPLAKSKMDTYFSQHVSVKPDAFNTAIDFVMSKTAANPALKGSLLSSLMTKFVKFDRVGFDQVAVYLADKHLTPDMKDVLGSQEYGRIRDKGEGLSKVVIGATVKPFTLNKIKDGSEFSLSDVKTKYKVIFFWSPDCEECEKSIPGLVSFRDSYPQKDITIINICSAVGEYYGTCLWGVENKGLEGFINLGDKSGNSKVFEDYHMVATPSVFVLDENNKILIRKIGVNVLPMVMKDIEKGPLRFY